MQHANSLHHNYVFQPGLRMSYEYQRHLATRQMPYQEKCPIKLQNFFDSLSRAIRHPDKLNLYLSKVYGKPLHGRGPFQDSSESTPAESSEQYDPLGIRKSGVHYPTPVTPNHSINSRYVRPDDRSHLATAIIAGKLSFKPLQIVLDLVTTFANRVEDKSSGLSITDADSGLPQLAGFCFQILKITKETIKSSACIEGTSNVGLKIASEFLQDPHGLYFIMKGRLPKVDEFSKEDNVTAKIKMHVAQDEAIAAYQRMGRGGFEGNWASSKGHNPDIISPDEMQTVIFAFLNALMVLTKWANANADLFDVLVYSDDIEKTYVLAHLRSMRIQDHIDIVLKIDELRQFNKKINKLLLKIYTTAEEIIFTLCPPRKPDGTFKYDPELFRLKSVVALGAGDCDSSSDSEMSSSQVLDYKFADFSFTETKKKKIKHRKQRPTTNVMFSNNKLINQTSSKSTQAISRDRNQDPEYVIKNVKRMMDEMKLVIKKLQETKLSLNEISTRQVDFKKMPTFMQHMKASKGKSSFGPIPVPNADAKSPYASSASGPYSIYN